MNNVVIAVTLFYGPPYRPKPVLNVSSSFSSSLTSHVILHSTEEQTPVCLVGNKHKDGSRRAKSCATATKKNGIAKRAMDGSYLLSKRNIHF